MRLATTGASGQFGQQVTNLLLEKVEPKNLILVSRTPERLASYEEKGCHVRFGDFDDPSSLEAAFDGAEKLLLISGTRVGKRLPQHGAAIDAAKKVGVKHVVYTSFLGADNPLNQSEAVKDHRGTEQLLRDSGVTWTALRNAQYADAVTDVMVYTIVKDGVMLSLAGDGRMPFVWRSDCVEAAAAALLGTGHENKGYNITGPELISYREVGGLIAEFTGNPVDVQLTHEDGLYAVFDALGIPREPVDNFDGVIPWNSNDMVSFEVAVRDGHFAVPSDDFQKLTGKPARSLRTLFESKVEEIRSKAV